jgi:CRISPR associated protein Cas1
MPRPLCLDGRKTPLSIELVGQALLARAKGTADQLVPLSRIDRILCWGEVAWTSSALRAVAGAGPNILFLSGRDELAAILSPPRLASAGLSAILEVALTHADWDERLADWQAHIESLLFRDAAKRTPGYPHPPPWRCADLAAVTAWNQLLRPALPLIGPAALRRTFAAHLAAWVRTRLATREVDRRWLGGSRMRPDLSRCFSTAFEWSAMPATVRFAQMLSRAGARGRGRVRPLAVQIAESFVAEEPVLAPRFDLALAKLRIIVGDLAERTV